MKSPVQGASEALRGTLEPLTGSIPPKNSGPRAESVKPRYDARTVLWDLRGFKPLPWQEIPLTEIGLPPEKGGPRFYPINVGRGAGKTTLAPELVWEAATVDWNDGLGPPQVKIFADTFEHGQLIWDECWQDAATTLKPFIQHLDGERRIITLGRPGDPTRPGASIQLLSADQERMLTGHNKTTFALTDESQFIKEVAWKQFQPCLNIRKGVWAGFGVCQGQNWYKAASLRGMDGDWPEYRTFSFPSTANPLFQSEQDELAKREYTPEMYAQLFLAQWTNAEGQVFENIDNCIINADIILNLVNGTPLILEDPKPGVSYAAGVDVAKVRDFMAVVIVRRDTGRVVAALRANKRTYTFLESLVANLLMMYAPMTYFDTTSMGEAVYEHIRTFLQHQYNQTNVGPHNRAMLFPMSLPLVKRQEIIDDLALALMQERLRFPHIKQLVSELRNFEKQVLPSGAVRMAAPDGLHDDMVFAAALAVQGLPPIVSTTRNTTMRQTGGWEKLRRW